MALYGYLCSLYQSESNIFYLIMYFHRFLLVILLPLILFACSGQDPEGLETGINRLVEQHEYEEALATLREADDEPQKVHRLKVQTHLAYANYLTHEADHLEMRDRMSDALRHFRRVLELDPDNSQAQTHIELIEGIYRQMGREIPEGVAS